VPFWYSLLFYWCFTKVPIGSGLTIPFLIGAETINGNRHNPITINQLLNEFQRLPVGYSISIRRCSMIGELVCSLDHGDSENEHYPSFGSLVITDFTLAPTKDYATILIKLHDLYSSNINSECFSKHHGKWQHFTDEDYEIITNGLAQQQLNRKSRDI
jgi:hypothetical protein